MENSWNTGKKFVKRSILYRAIGSIKFAIKYLNRDKQLAIVNTYYGIFKINNKRNKYILERYLEESKLIYREKTMSYI